MLVHQMSKRRSQVIGFELPVRVWSFLWLAGVLYQGFGPWTRIQKWCFQISLLHSLDLSSFVLNEIPPDMLHEKAIQFMATLMRTVVCLQYFPKMSLGRNSKY